MAVSHGSLDVVKLFISRYKIHKITIGNNIDMIKLLLSYGFVIEINLYMKMYPTVIELVLSQKHINHKLEFIKACQFGNLDIVKFIIKYVPDFDPTFNNNIALKIGKKHIKDYLVINH
jgi:hypothetical protein